MVETSIRTVRGETTLDIVVEADAKHTKYSFRTDQVNK